MFTYPTEHPTRANTILDYVFATKEHLVENIRVGEEFCNSDNSAITPSLNFTSSGSNNNNNKIPNFRKAKCYLLRTTFKETG